MPDVWAWPALLLVPTSWFHPVASVILKRDRFLSPQQDLFCAFILLDGDLSECQGNPSGQMEDFRLNTSLSLCQHWVKPIGIFQKKGPLVKYGPLFLKSVFTLRRPLGLVATFWGKPDLLSGVVATGIPGRSNFSALNAC